MTTHRRTVQGVVVIVTDFVVPGLSSFLAVRFRTGSDPQVLPDRGERGDIGRVSVLPLTMVADSMFISLPDSIVNQL